MVDPAAHDEVGANLPWVRYGCDFGANAWQPDGGLATRAPDDNARRVLDAAVAEGVTVVRWFLFCDGRAGIAFDGDEATGLDATVFDDIDAALTLCQAAGLRVVFVLFDFHWCHPARLERGVQLGGRRSQLTRGGPRASVIEHVASPIFRRYGAHRAVAAWDLFNEPEWITWRYGTANPLTGLRPSALRAFIGGLTRAARPLTSQPLTVGLASARGLPLVEGLGLDFYQVHWYDQVARGRLPQRVADLGVDRPVVLGEFPTAGSAFTVEAIVRHASDAGYAAAWPWSLLADDGATSAAAATRAAGAARLARAARRGEGSGFEERRA